MTDETPAPQPAAAPAPKAPAAVEAEPVSFVEQFYNPRLVSHETKAQEPDTPRVPQNIEKRG